MGALNGYGMRTRFESVPPDQIAGAFRKGASGKRGLVRGPRTMMRYKNKG